MIFIESFFIVYYDLDKSGTLTFVNIFLLFY